MTEEMRNDVVGGPTNEFKDAPVGKRVLAALFDLVFIPVIIGIVAGLLLFAAPTAVRTIVLVIINFLWVSFRDLNGAGPGKKMAGIKVVNGADGSKPSMGQQILRNLSFTIPFVLVIGYIVETIMVLMGKQRVCDNIANTKVVVVD